MQYKVYSKKNYNLFRNKIKTITTATKSVVKIIKFAFKEPGALHGRKLKMFKSSWEK